MSNTCSTYALVYVKRGHLQYPSGTGSTVLVEETIWATWGHEYIPQKDNGCYRKTRVPLKGSSPFVF